MHALIETINSSLASSSYLQETGLLLCAIKDQLLWYERALLAFQTAGRGDELITLSSEIAKALQSRHIEDIKGLCEGTTEVIPLELATYLNHEFRRLYQVNNVVGSPDNAAEAGIVSKSVDSIRGGIALCPFRQFNYFYHDVGLSLDNCFRGLNDLVRNQLAVLGPQPELTTIPSFPPSHAMIGFQYAMNDHVFYQAVLFHELGHHLFAAKHQVPYLQTFGDRLSQGLSDERFVHKILRDKLPEAEKSSPSNLGRLRGMWIEYHLSRFFLPWASELFSDAFAAALGGPQYGLAFHDITGPQRRANTFQREHPADLLRWHNIWTTLDSLGWIDGQSAKLGVEIAPDPSFLALATQMFSILRPDPVTKDTLWSFGWPADKESLEVVIEVLFDSLGDIAQDATDCVQDSKRRCIEFWTLGPAVKKTYEQAIVPSFIVLPTKLEHVPAVPIESLFGDGAGSPRWAYRPQPSTVMNVARLLYQTGATELMSRWPAGQGEEVEDRQFIIYSRLSEWTQKAIADWLLTQGKPEYAQ